MNGSSTIAPIFLIGYRGTGKTTVARKLAARLGRELIDTDDQVEQRLGQSIADFFRSEGEAAFREVEASVVEQSAAANGHVVALGGGAVLRAENRAAIRRAGPVVWLAARVETLVARLAADSATPNRRPNLTAAGTLGEIEAVLAQRTPIYRACATLVVDTDRRTPDEVTDQIVALLGSLREGAG